MGPVDVVSVAKPKVAELGRGLHNWCGISYWVILCVLYGRITCDWVVEGHAWAANIMLQGEVTFYDVKSEPDDVFADTSPPKPPQPTLV